MSRTVVIGPPGTGKTSYLIGRVGPDGDVAPGIVLELISQGIEPEQIAFVSYSRAAVREARDRVVKCTGIDAHRWRNFATLHSAWARRLNLGREAYLTRADLKAFASETGYPVSPFDADSDDGETPLGSFSDADLMLRAWDWCRQTMRQVADLPWDKLPDGQQIRNVAEIAEAYESWKAAKGKVDHTDIIVQAHRQGLTLDATHVLVDEAQDLSPLQVATLVPTIAAADAVWVVGDPDQAIYSFQGASPAWIQGLWNQWNRHTLSRSYRCPAPVLAAAKQVIERCTDRIDVAYDARSDVGAYHGACQSTTAIAVARHYVTQRQSVLMLGRTQASCGNLARLCFDAGLPYRRTRGSGPDPLGRSTIMRALDTLRLLAARAPVTIVQLTALLELIPGTGFVVRGAKRRVAAIETPTFDYAQAESVGIAELISKASRPHDILWRALPVGPDGRDELGWLLAIRNPDGTWPTPLVEVTTFHNAKGREADLVVIDPSIPRIIKRELQRGDANSEHRAAYVALTRAREACLVLMPELAKSYNFPRST